MPAFKVGVLDDAIKKGDKAALEYYNVPAKHWTSQSWNEINMDKVDIGLHSDPTATGGQAADRRLATMLRSGAGVDDTKDLRIHIGNELVAEDVGDWDNPQATYQGILNALEDVGDWDTAEQFAEEFSYLPRGSTIKGDVDAVSNMAAMRDFLLGKDYDTITYKNTSEGADAASDAYLKDPEWQAYESETKAKIKDLELRASELYRAGKTDSGSASEGWNDSGLRQQYEDLISQASELDDDLEYERSDAMQRAADENISHISLDPGNVRSADAAFSKENIGKAGMMLGLGGAGFLAGGSQDAEAGFVDRAGKTVLEAWHGSPHNFDRFDMSKIGTGEGAQAYGHGLYFADNKAVAENYRDTLTKVSQNAFGGTAIPDSTRSGLIDMSESMQSGSMDLTPGDIASGGISELIAGDFDVDTIRRKVTENAIDEGVDPSEALKLFEGAVDYANKSQGALYGVDIDVRPEQLLDWDKPFSEQSDAVQKALQHVVDQQRDIMSKRPHIYTSPVEDIISRRTGGDWLDYFSDVDGNILRPQDVSARLNESGVKGISYLDGGSRSAGDGTSNYVMFDDRPINIRERGFADPRLLAGGGTAAALGIGLATGSQDAEAGVLPKRFLDPNYTPTNTQTAYKMFRTDGDELYPLFVDRNTPVNVGDWQRAIAGDMDPKTGKVKSSLGGLAYRPGWHAGDNAAATHIGGKSDPLLKAPDIRKTDQVWAEVLMGDDFNWQDIANQRAARNKSGEIVPRTAQIDDQVPYGGSYRYKTNPNMTGEWLIGGDMKVNRVLSDEEVADINASKGYADLPRREKSRFLDPLLEKYGKTLSALVPSATIGALAGMSPLDAGAATLDVASRAAEAIPNELSTGGAMIASGITGSEYDAPQVNFAPEVESGDSLSNALMEDFGTFMRDTPLGQDVMSALSYAGDAYGAIEPYLNDRVAQVLGGTAIIGGTLLGQRVGLDDLAAAGRRGLDNLATPGPVSGGLNAQRGAVGNLTDNPLPNTAQRNRLAGNVVNEVPQEFVGDPVRMGQEEYLTSDKRAQPPKAIEGRLGPIAGALLEDAKAGGFQHTMENRISTSKLPVLRRSDLEDAVLMPVKGDASADALLTRYYGALLDEPVALDAGPAYGIRNNVGDNPEAWASTVGNAQGIASKAKAVAEHSGSDKVLGITRRMADGAMSFNTMPLTTANSLYRQYGHLDQDHVRSMNQAAQNIDDGFPGWMDEDLPAYLTKASPKTRKALLALMADQSKGGSREQAFGAADLIRSGIDHEMINDPVRSYGRVITQLDTSGQINAGAPHNTYNSGVRAVVGGTQGRLAAPASGEAVFDRIYSYLLGQEISTKRGTRTLTEEEAANRLSDSHPFRGFGPSRTDGYIRMTPRELDRLEGAGLILP